MEEMAVIAIEVAADHAIDQADFAFGVKPVAQVDLAADVDQVGIQRLHAGGNEPPPVAIEVAADPRAAHLDAAFGAELAIKRDVRSNVGTLHVDRHLTVAGELAAGA